MGCSCLLGISTCSTMDCSTHICSVMVLSICCRKIHASLWSLNGLQRKLCSGVWTTSFSSFFSSFWWLWDWFSHFFFFFYHSCSSLPLSIFFIKAPPALLFELALVSGRSAAEPEMFVSCSRKPLASSHRGHLSCSLRLWHVYLIVWGTLSHLLQPVDPHCTFFPICSGLCISWF